MRADADHLSLARALLERALGAQWVKTDRATCEQYGRDESDTGEFPADWQKALTALLNDAVLGGAEGRFVLLSDGDLSHFAVNACQVNQHVRIDDETGTAEDGGLFNEETVPSETLFYSVLNETRKLDGKNDVFDTLASEQLIQFGGNGTTGLGFCTVKLA